MRKLKYILFSGAFLGISFISLFLTGMNTAATTCTDLVLRYGSTGTCVVTLQQRLNYFKCAAGPADGNFGSVTYGAVRRFQTDNSLYVDGVVGSQTWGRLYSSLAKNCDDDVADRALCTNAYSKCILVHRTGGKNRIELYENKKLVAATTVNTGKAGYRTRNTTGTYIYEETFKTEASETVTNASYGVNPKTWAPGVRQIYGSETGLMGDPHKFNGGQAFHWRVLYSGAKDEYGKSIPVLYNGLAQESYYDGGYWSHGCVHVPKWFIDKYDSTFFQYGVRVKVQDQPTT